MAIAAIIGGVQAAGAFGKYLAARRMKPPKFAGTAEGRALQQRAQQGIYSPSTQSRVLSGTVGPAANVAGQRTAALRGYLAATGMQRSVAGARLLDTPQQDVTRLAGDTANRLQVENELSKEDARMLYAQKLTENQAARKGINAQALGGLVEGVTGAATGYLGARQQQQMYDLAEHIRRLIEAGDIKTALKLLDQMGVMTDGVGAP